MKKLQKCFYIILFNLIPVAGVFFLDWKAEQIVWLYWVETFIFGTFVIIKLAYASKNSEGLLKFIFPSWMFLAYGMLLIISYAMTSDWVKQFAFITFGDIWYGVLLIFIYQLTMFVQFVNSAGESEDVWNQAWKRYFIQIYSLGISGFFIGNANMINMKYGQYILLFALVITRMYWEFRYAKDELKFEEGSKK